MRPVEAAEYERIIGQSGLTPRRRFRRDDSFAVVGLVARKPDNPLRVIDLRSLWDDPVVRDNVVMIGRTHRSRVAEPIHLHGRRAAGEYSGPRIARMPVDVHEDIDAVGCDFAGSVNPGGQRAFRVRPAIIGEHFDVALSVAFKKLRHQISNRMIAQIR